MKKLLDIAASVAVWVAIAAYLIWAGRTAAVRKRDLMAAGVEVVVKDSARMKVITPGMVRAWIAAEGLIPANSAASEIPADKIARLVRSRGFVRDAVVYTDLRGVTHVELSQRHPVVRFCTWSGYNCYITDDGWVLPAQPHEAMWLPVITGDYMPPFDRAYAGPLKKDEKNYTEKEVFLRKLINFVQFINQDDFWSACIEQINVVERSGGSQGIGVYDPKVEIVPRAGNHLVVLGSLDDFRGKLSKLLSFYREGLRYEGWDTYKIINLEFEGQVVCSQ